MTDEKPVYFHGGVPGLNEGDWLRARDLLPQWKGTKFAYGATSPERAGNYGSHVYLTTELEPARAYAAKYVDPANNRIPGTVYEVEPWGEVYSDPDFLPYPFTFGRSVGAKVSRVVETGLLWENPRDMARVLGPYQEWTTGMAVYDEKGYFRVNKDMRDMGITEERVAQMGKWAPVEYMQAILRGQPTPQLPPEL